MGELGYWAIFGLFTLVPAMVFSIPLLMIWTHHRRRMEELRLQRQAQVPTEIRAELQSMRAEIQSLRDTTTQYDISFDSSLQRFESRLTRLETGATTGQAAAQHESTWAGGR